jgi:spore germination cell wall hydrolase CwlJ-like protein
MKLLRNCGRRRSGRRVPLISKWWGHVRFLWDTGNRIPLVIGAAASVLLVMFASAMHAKTVRDTRRAELNCLALNVYYESRGEPIEGQYAVAEVTMNRAAHPRYPDSICKTVYQKNWDYLRKRYVGAFSWTELDEIPAPRGMAWERAVNVAETMYSGNRADVLGGALHYHAVHIRPSWSRGEEPVAKIGRHLFFK